MRKLSGARGVAALGWVSLFVEIWLLILGVIQFSGFNLFGLVFFFVVAIFASAASDKK